jgi:hypothetical protein
LAARDRRAARVSEPVAAEGDRRCASSASATALSVSAVPVKASRARIISASFASATAAVRPALARSFADTPSRRFSAAVILGMFCWSFAPLMWSRVLRSWSDVSNPAPRARCSRARSAASSCVKRCTAYSCANGFTSLGLRTVTLSR